MAASPLFRKKSSTYVDAIHDLPEKGELAPAQLYTTESGRLFHSGRIVIITVGLPARGKTFVAVYLPSSSFLFLLILKDSSGLTDPNLATDTYLLLLRGT